VRLYTGGNYNPNKKKSFSPLLLIFFMASVDIFVGNGTIIDPDVYQLWLNGYSGK
jgi:hypothetical protein